MVNIQEKYIMRCLELAKNGLGKTRPNPMVGCVIVLGDEIIGEGFTSPAGGNHAEVNAINAVRDRSLLSKATLYVSLEPCDHYGKTPPCTELIIKHNISKVVIGTEDPHIKVAGKGVQKLRDAGVDVTVGVLQGQCEAINHRFFCFHRKKRPYTILKWAETADGFISPLPNTGKKTAEAKPVWISGFYSQQLVHKWRSEEQAILVGANTVRTDDPQLTTRHWAGENPVRLVLDRQLKLDRGHKIFDSAAPTIVFTAKNGESKRDNITYVQVGFGDELISEINKVLFRLNIQSVIVEGGEKTLTTFIRSGNWDEARIFIGKKTFGQGIASPKIDGKIFSATTIFNDELLILKP